MTRNIQSMAESARIVASQFDCTDNSSVQGCNDSFNDRDDEPTDGSPSGRSPFLSDDSFVEDFGYENPEDFERFARRGSAASRRDSWRHSVGDGLAPRRNSIARSDCRQNDDLKSLQFSRRHSLDRSDHKSISDSFSSFNEEADFDEQEEVPRRPAVRRSSMAALVNRNKGFSMETTAGFGVSRRHSMSFMIKEVTSKSNASPPKRRGVSRWASCSTQSPLVQDIANASPPRRSASPFSRGVTRRHSTQVPPMRAVPVLQ